MHRDAASSGERDFGKRIDLIGLLVLKGFRSVAGTLLRCTKDVDCNLQGNAL